MMRRYTRCGMYGSSPAPGEINPIQPKSITIQSTKENEEITTARRNPARSRPPRHAIDEFFPKIFRQAEFFRISAPLPGGYHCGWSYE